MVSPRDVRSSEVDDVTAMQYLASHLLEEMNKKGYIKGSFPKYGILSPDERMLLNRMKRDNRFVYSETDPSRAIGPPGQPFDDEAISQSIKVACLSLHNIGYTFSLDVSNALRSIAGD